MNSVTKNNFIFLKIRTQTHYLFCKRQRWYHSATKTRVTERILKFTLIHASLILSVSLNSLNSVKLFSIKEKTHWSTSDKRSFLIVIKFKAMSSNAELSISFCFFVDVLDRMMSSVQIEILACYHCLRRINWVFAIKIFYFYLQDSVIFINICQ